MPAAKQLTMPEIAEQAGITAQTVAVYRYRGIFPEPDGYIGRTPWWKQSTVNTWLRNRRSPGRPRKVA